MGKSAKASSQDGPLDLANEVRNFVNREARELARTYNLHRGAFDTFQERAANILKRTVRVRTRDGWLLPAAWFLTEFEREKLNIPFYDSLAMPGHPFREIPFRPRFNETPQLHDLTKLQLKGNAPILSFSPSLREALEAIPENHVLDVFESEDVEKLTHELWFLDELKQQQGPAFTLTELAETIRNFIGYLQHQNDSGRILETGEPTTGFYHCPWLHQRLSRKRSIIPFVQV